MEIYQYKFHNYIFRVHFDKDVTIYIFNGDVLWKSEQSIASAKTSVTIDKQLDLIYQALKYEDQTSFDFVFDEKKETLSILIQLQNVTGSVVIGKFSFQKVQNKSIIMKMFSFYIKKIEDLEIINLDLDILASDRDRAVQLAKVTLEEKKQVEDELYTSFIHIVNEKKIKIKQLEQELENCLHPKPKRTYEKKVKPKRLDELDDEEILQRLMLE